MKEPGKHLNNQNVEPSNGLLLDDLHLEDEPPPFFGSWRRIYAGVIAFLVFFILCLYLFSRAFTP